MKQKKEEEKREKEWEEIEKKREHFEKTCEYPHSFFNENYDKIMYALRKIFILTLKGNFNKENFNKENFNNIHLYLPRKYFENSNWEINKAQKVLSSIFEGKKIYGKEWILELSYHKGLFGRDYIEIKPMII